MMTPTEFTTWALGRGLPRGTIEQLIHFAASPEAMKAAFDAVEPPPPIYSLADVVGMTDEDPFGLSPLENGFVIIGGCPNGDPIAIDVAHDPGSVWYIDHETMSERPIRDAAVRVARDASALVEGLAGGTFPVDYYNAANR